MSKYSQVRDAINLYRRSKTKEEKKKAMILLNPLIEWAREDYLIRMSKINPAEEVWKDVIGFEGYYQVSNFGRLKSLSRKWAINQKILIGCLHKLGYIKFCMRKDNGYFVKFAHVIEANAFLPNPDNKPQINHKDEIKWNNFLPNLEWADNSENQVHAHSCYDINHNTAKGEDHTNAKLNNKDVIDIRKLLSDGVMGKDISIKYGVSTSLISHIKRNKKRIV